MPAKVLKDVNRKSLKQASMLVELIHDVTNLINYFSDETRQGPAYLNFEYLGGLGLKEDLQIDRDVMVETLQIQCNRYEEQLEALGFNAVPDD